MSKRFRFFIAALFLAPLFSCNLVSFENFWAAVSVDEKQNYYNAPYVAFSFSDDMNEAAAGNLFSIKEEGSAAEKELLWAGKNCYARVKGGFKKGFKYSVTLYGSALTKDGRSYGVDLYREFIFGSESGLFRLERIDEPEKNNFEKNALVFTFNKKIDKAFFERALSISPSLDTKKIYDDEKKQAKIIPAAKWAANQVYKWKLDGALSEDGFKAEKDYSGSFIAVEKTQEPRLQSACPVISGCFHTEKSLDQLWENEGIGLVFDCEMDFESIKKGAAFSPNVDGFWTKKDERSFYFTPAANFKVGENYALEIRDSIEDLYGLKLKENLRFDFKTQNAFIEARVLANGAGLEKGGVNEVFVAQGSPFLAEIDFSSALDAASAGAIRTAVSLENFFPAGAKTPGLLCVTYAGANRKKFLLEFADFDYSEPGKETIYRLRIKGGPSFVFNDKGECLKEDECFLLSFKK